MNDPNNDPMNDIKVIIDITIGSIIGFLIIKLFKPSLDNTDNYFHLYLYMGYLLGGYFGYFWYIVNNVVTNN